MNEPGRRSDSQDLALLLMVGIAAAGGWKLWQTRIGPVVTNWLDQHAADGPVAGLTATDLVLLAAGVVLLVLVVGSIRRRGARARRAEPER